MRKSKHFAKRLKIENEILSRMSRGMPKEILAKALEFPAKRIKRSFCTSPTNKFSIKNEYQTTLSYKKPDCNSFRIFKIVYWNRQTFHLSI